MEFGFELKMNTDSEDEAQAQETQYYACENDQDRKKWLEILENVIKMKYQDLDTKVLVSKGLIEDYRDFKIQIRNRRENIEKYNRLPWQPGKNG